MSAAARLAAAALLLLGGVVGLATAGPAAPASAQTVDTGPRFVELVVASTTPAMVTADTTELAVAGTLRNTGDRSVEELAVRLQRAAPVATATELGAGLRTTPEDFEAVGEFEPVADVLGPGESVDFRVSVPLFGEDSLSVTAPGVYPVLVNVNGAPDFGDQARLDSGHVLLPVLSVPPVDGVVAAPAAPPVGMGVLWPLADRPRLLPVAAGAPAVLADDELAASFAAGGRLRGLLDAVRGATTDSADPGGRLRAGLCLAVDPDLLVTAEDMQDGYLVRAEDGTTGSGRGADAARSWLADLRTVAAGSCVLALPWAQADLNAVSRAGLAELQERALRDGTETVARLLGVAPQPGIVLPGTGALTDTAVDALGALGTTGVVLEAGAVRGAAGELPAGTSAVRLGTAAGTEVAAALVDPATSAALAATGSDPEPVAAPADEGGGGPVAGGRDPAAQRVLRLQDAVGALAWPALVGPGSAAEPTGAPVTVLVSPPQDWGVDEDEATAVLRALDDLLEAGRAAPASVPGLLGAAVASAVPAAVPDYPVEATAAEVPTAEVVAADAALRAFTTATTADAQTGVEPGSLVDPLRVDLLRAVSLADPDPARASAVQDLLGELFMAVSLQTPGGIYTLASEESPLLLVVRNDLPVAVQVRVLVAGPPGLTASDIGLQQVPAGSSVQLEVPTTIVRSGQFSVDVSLSTADGQVLGDPTRLLVRSTAYGPATAAVTGVAGLVLLVLVGRRLLHRFRGQPDRADEGRVLP